MIPENITRSHILKAIEEMNKSGFPQSIQATNYIQYDDKYYPADLTISLANRLANGNELQPSSIAEEDLNIFFKSRKFDIENRTLFLTKEKITEVLKEECTIRNLNFEYLLDGFAGKVENGFSISNQSNSIKVYGNVLSSSMKNQIWQGISERLYNFYESKESNSFITILDTLQNQFLVIPFSVLKPIMYNQKSGYDINKNFNINRNPNYHLYSNKKDLSQYVDNFDSLFDRFDNDPDLVAKSYDELVRYIRENRMNANYQPVVIKNLIENYDGSTKQEIENELRNYNPVSGSQSMTDTVLSVLQNNKIIKKNNDKYILNLSKELNVDEKRTILSLCDERIKQFPYQNTQIHYWQISPGENASLWDENKNNGVITVDGNELGDLTGRTSDGLYDSIRAHLKGNVRGYLSQFQDFLSIKEGDIVVANKGYSKIVGIGKVTGPYQYRPDLTLHHSYPVEWFDTTEKNYPSEMGEWRKTISSVSPDLYDIILSAHKSQNFLLLRHQPEFKRSKKEREYWADLMGIEYHYGKNVPNYTKLLPNTKTVWFYTNENDIFFWGQGEVNEITDLSENKFKASYDSFRFFNNQKAAVKAPNSLHQKITSQNSWNPYNSIVEINKDIYEEIVASCETKGEMADPSSVEQASSSDEFEDIPLAEPEKNRIEEALRQINEKLLIDINSVMQIVVNLISGRHLIIAGPVGTGKTTLASLVSELFWTDDTYSGYYSDIHTATADWNSQDVIGGIMPRMRDNEPTYEIVLGCVSDTILKNWSTTNSKSRTSTLKNGKKFKGTWLVIDEFNRADIDKALGQLFTALETRTLKIPVMDNKSGYEERRIPLDYRIIGTLNTADKHYLFKLSDALKRRFAYVEISPPGRKLKETEIYYALKNALSELDPNYLGNLLILDHTNLTIDVDRSDKKLIAIIIQGYEILDLVRMTKPLGTAVLKSIYKTILVGVKLTNNYEGSLDMAINSNLIPQLESLGLTSLETLYSILIGNVMEFFKQKHESNEKDQYQNDFRNFLNLIGSNNPDLRAKEFVQHINTDVWISIEKSYLPYKKENHCTLFKAALQDLLKSSMT